ncbi:hypothetical protein DFH06DRAFT_1122392 [Mycena polygramma]|nr:hypothetical protein DFH06DRAFT_1122392 [Mycena polygramma]
MIPTRRFIVIISLAFLMPMGIIHTLLHLLPASVICELGIRPSSHTLIATSAGEMRNPVLLLWKIMVASSIIALAVREIVSVVGECTGWWNVEAKEEDAEVGDKNRESDRNKTSDDSLGPTEEWIIMRVKGLRMNVMMLPTAGARIAEGPNRRLNLEEIFLNVKLRTTPSFSGVWAFMGSIQPAAGESSSIIPHVFARGSKIILSFPPPAVKSDTLHNL